MAQYDEYGQEQNPDEWLPQMPPTPTADQYAGWNNTGTSADWAPGWETRYSNAVPAAAAASAAPAWDKNARNSVRDAWMSGTGSLQDFYNNSQYKDQLRIDGDHLYLKPTIDDKYGYMGDENIDAVLDYGPGGQNKHVWTGMGPGSDGGGGGSAPGSGAGIGAGGSAGGWGPDDALSKLINQKYMDIIGGGGSTSGFGKTLQDSLSSILKGGGKGTPMNAAEFESIRQPIEKGRRAQTNQAMSELASRGLLGEGGGHQQGPERTALSRIESEIAPDWASALQRASTEHDKLGMGLFGSALGVGEQEAGRETSQVLDAMQGATGRQNAISQIALQNLSENRLWNQFISQFGLDQQKVAADIQNGNVANLIPLLQMFSQNSKTSSEGHV